MKCARFVYTISVAGVCCLKDVLFSSSPVCLSNLTVSDVGFGYGKRM